MPHIDLTDFRDHPLRDLGDIVLIPVAHTNGIGIVSCAPDIGDDPEQLIKYLTNIHPRASKRFFGPKTFCQMKVLPQAGGRFFCFVPENIEDWDKEDYNQIASMIAGGDVFGPVIMAWDKEKNRLGYFEYEEWTIPEGRKVQSQEIDFFTEDEVNRKVLSWINKGFNLEEGEEMPLKLEKCQGCVKITIRQHYVETVAK